MHAVSPTGELLILCRVYTRGVALFNVQNEKDICSLSCSPSNFNRQHRFACDIFSSAA